VAVSFIGEGNRSTRWKPPACHKSLTNFIALCYMNGIFKLTTLVVIDT